MEIKNQIVIDVLVTNLREIIIKLDYPSIESFETLTLLINAHNELATDDDIKICDIMNNQSLINVMKTYENFNARIISDLYNSIRNNNINNTPFFLYNSDIMVHDIEMLGISSIGEIKDIICTNLNKIVWATLKTPENPVFTPIYKILFNSIFSD